MKLEFYIQLPEIPGFTIGQMKSG